LAFESNSTLSEIWASAFHACSSLPSIFIPSSVKTIGAKCFQNCGSISEVRFEPDSRIAHFDQIAFGLQVTVIDLHSFFSRNYWWGLFQGMYQSVSRSLPVQFSRSTI
jgi:hypothetical protein